jgi:hypothetical protein
MAIASGGLRENLSNLILVITGRVSSGVWEQGEGGGIRTVLR